MTDPKFLRKASETPALGYSAPSVSGSALPADILEEASKRLGRAGLIYAIVFFLAYFGSMFFTYGLERAHLMVVQSVVAAVCIALGLAVFLVARFANVRPDLLLDLGLVFEVVGAFGIAMSEYWAIYPEWDEAILENYLGIPWECVWIIIFPLIAPNTPGKILLASLGAASMGLLAVLISKSFGATSPEAPFTVFVGYFLFTTYLCAGIAFVISRIIYGFGARLKKAREIGSYQLVEPMGQGGMGEVWVAKHRMLARPAAIKLIRPELLGADDENRTTVLKRFEREARATAALRSYHTIVLYDFGVTAEGAFYYVMELLEGLNLDSLVKRFGPIPAQRTVYLLRQVCHSLGEAHGNGLIHRDIKPANIYVCRLGPDFDFVKVLDFGLVKSSEDVQTGATKLTGEGVTTGTPAFMPPEMAMGESHVDGRADIYALGCVGYWLLTGQLVFKGESALATVLQHVQAPPVPPSKRTELEIPESLERIIMSCLEKDPSNRPQSAGELDSMLAASIPDDVWTGEKAEEWWRLHLPEVISARTGELVVSPTPQELLSVKR